LLAQPRGQQSRANVQRLLALTRQFDQFQRQGLFRFLRFVEAQLDAEADLEPAAPAADDAVQLMSIHQSKGLDFPVVVVADLGKRFNFDDLKERLILDEQYGLCPKVKPPHTARVYPSLPYWLAQRRQRRETLGEELRLFYVATTRARDLLVLTGTASRKSVEEKWTGAAGERLSVPEILGAKSWLDWLGKGLARIGNHADWTASGDNPLLTWTTYDEADERLHSPNETDESAPAEPPLTISLPELASLREKLEWQYAFEPATTEPAKTSVSALRRRLREESDDEAKPLLPVADFRFQVRPRARNNKLSAAEIGTAHHVFLQMADFDRLQTRHDLRNEAERLREAGVLSDAELASLDFAVLLAFWDSELGQRIRVRPASEIQREMPFTARFSRADLAAAGVSANEALPASEFVVAQGTIDLAVIQEKEIWLVDFKTDRVKPDELELKTKLYTPQLRLYGLALSRIFQRPVKESWLYFLSAREVVRVDNQ
jgi:ATP-dependent helicase/nuclease subunit A